MVNIWSWICWIISSNPRFGTIFAVVLDSQSVFFSGFPVGSATRTRGKTISNVVAELGRFFVVVWFQRDAQIQGLLDCKWHSAAESAQNGLGPGFRYMTHIKAGHGKCTGLSDFWLFRRVSRCVFFRIPWEMAPQWRYIPLGQGFLLATFLIFVPKVRWPGTRWNNA